MEIRFTPSDEDVEDGLRSAPRSTWGQFVYILLLALLFFIGTYLIQNHQPLITLFGTNVQRSEPENKRNMRFAFKSPPTSTAVSILAVSSPHGIKLPPFDCSTTKLCPSGTTPSSHNCRVVIARSLSTPENAGFGPFLQRISQKIDIFGLRNRSKIQPEQSAFPRQVG
jgi:hypothetical protein